MKLKENVNKCQETTKTQVLNEIIRIIQDMKIKLQKEIGSLKKSQTEIKLKMKYSESQIKSSEENLTYKLDQVEEKTYLADRVK